jgi:hypothetical protein
MEGFNSAAPKNKLQKALHETNRLASQPPDDQIKITYGVISEINNKNGQVKVKRLTADGKVGGLISGSFLPLATPFSEIYLLWGALREGLVVRVYSKGKLTQKNAIIEVIGDEGHSFVTKAPYQNEVGIGAYRIFGPGIGI